MYNKGDIKSYYFIEQHVDFYHIHMDYSSETKPNVIIWLMVRQPYINAGVALLQLISNIHRERDDMQSSTYFKNFKLRV